MPHAARVATMWSLRYGASLTSSLGSTLSFCTASGSTPRATTPTAAYPAMAIRRVAQQAAAQHAVHHQPGGDQRHDRRDADAGQHHVHVGVARAHQRTGGGIQQFGRPHDPEAHGRRARTARRAASPRVARPPDRPSDGRARWAAGPAARTPTPAAPSDNVVEQAQHGDGRRDGGQLEQIEPDVAPEQRIGAPHRCGMERLEERHPQRAHRDGHQERQEQRAQPQHARHDPRDVQRRLVHAVNEQRRQLALVRRRDADVAAQDGIRHQATDHEQDHTPDERRDEHRRESDLAKPEPVGGEARQPGHHEQREERQGQDGDDQASYVAPHGGNHPAAGSVKWKGHGLGKMARSGPGHQCAAAFARHALDKAASLTRNSGVVPHGPR